VRTLAKPKAVYRPSYSQLSQGWLKKILRELYHLERSTSKGSADLSHAPFSTARLMLDISLSAEGHNASAQPVAQLHWLPAT
jgi:hypothetical protein